MTVAEVAEKPLVVLVDLSALFWSAWHSSGEDEVSRARARTLESVQKCWREGALMAICCDEGQSFRKRIAPEYKANRPEKDHASLEQLRLTKEKLRADGYLLWGVSGYEADDVIATAAKLARDAGHEVLIASADKDLCQLLGPGVRALRTNTWQEADAGAVEQTFGVPPSKLGDWLALVGDSSDNVKGAPGIGPKKATALLQTYGSLSGIWAALESDRNMEVVRLVGAKCAENLYAAQQQVSRARVLVSLRDNVEIDFAEIYQRRERQEAPAEQETNMDEDAAEYAETKTPAVEVVPPPPQEEKPAPANPPPMEAPTTRALVAVPAPYEQQLEPTSIGTAYKLAKGLFDSRLYTRFPTPEAIMAVIIRGREMGLGALTALDVFHVIENKPCPFAYLLIARAKAHPDCEYFQCVEADDQHAIWETKNRRNPKPTRVTFTYEQAVKADLPKVGSRGPNGWIKNPEDMCVKSAGVKLARREYPEALLGLYAVEEMSGADV